MTATVVQNDNHYVDHSKDDLPPDFETCRFYDTVFPAKDDYVVVLVTEISQIGVKVVLSEYENIEGLMQLSELSKRRIRSISKLIWPGKTEVCVVDRVDEQKGFVDVSKKKVAASDAKLCLERYAKARTVQSMMYHVSTLVHLRLPLVCERLSWPLYRKYGYGLHDLLTTKYSAYTENFAEVVKGLVEGALTEQAAKQGSPVTFDPESAHVSAADLYAALASAVAARVKPQPIEIRSTVELTCRTSEGILRIKEALIKARDLVTPLGGSVKLLSTPVYVVSVTGLEKNEMFAAVRSAIEAAKDSIEASGGTYRVVTEPQIMGDHEEVKPAEQEEGEGDENKDDKESESESESESD